MNRIALKKVSNPNMSQDTGISHYEKGCVGEVALASLTHANPADTVTCCTVKTKRHCSSIVTILEVFHQR